MICVERDFTATGPNELWVADLTYVRTAAGWVLSCRVHPRDGLSRSPDSSAGRSPSSLYTDLALDALRDGDLGVRVSATDADLAGLVDLHHSDRGVQYRAIRYIPAARVVRRRPASVRRPR